MKYSVRFLTLVLLAGFATTACDRKSGITESDNFVSGITITPNPATMTILESRQFSAAGINQVGGGAIAVTPVWSVVSGGGTISSAGVFTAGAQTGSFTQTIMATSNGLTATATVIVTVGPITSITVTPTPATLAVGTTQQFTAVGRDAANNIVSFTPTWTMAGAGGTISGAGLFTAGGTPGTYTGTVRASNGTVNGVATVIVTAGPLANMVITPDPATMAVGATQQYIATSTDAFGNVIANSPVWSVTSGGGTINATGLFTAGTTPGAFNNTIRAQSGIISATATAIVTAGPLATIVVTPNPVTLEMGGTQQFTAVGRDAGGNVVAITPAWSVANGGGIIVGNGLFTAGTTAGTFSNTVRATSGGVSGSATVTVNPAPQVLTTITVVPDPAMLAPGQTQQFTAVGRDAQGVEMAMTAAWSVTSGGGTIGANGLFTAGADGGTFSNTVRATSGGVSGTATVIITAVAPVLASITVTPDPASVERNGVRQFTATGRDADGNVMAITPVWTVTNGGGTINATGRFTAGNATGTFDNTVRATSGGISDRATVIVTAAVPVLTTITVTPDPATMGRNDVQQFTAVGRDANGGIMDITPVWTVTNGGGTINATGRFTAGNTTGTFNNTVRATSGGVSGNATVIVQAAAPVLATITVTPDPASMGRNDVQQFTAVGRDTDGNVMVISPVWSVTNGGGTINANGRFTAGNQTGTFNNTVRATSGGVSGRATVVVTGGTPPPTGVNLGAAASNGIMAGTAVTCVNLGVINADVSISPGNTITGFGPCVITGVQNLANAIAAQAQIDLTTAFNQLAGMACPPANAISANLGGTTLEAGVYCTATGIGVTGTLTLDGGGDPNAMFVFQAGTSLTTAGNVVLINGAQAKNVYWLVGSSATIGTASQWQGNIIALTSITLVDNATLTGRALARNGAVSLGTGNVINLP